MALAEDDPELTALRDAGAAGDEALAAFFEQHRPRLERMVRRRMDTRLALRVDPADVLQETFLEVSARWPDYLASPDMPPFIWLRFLASQRLITLYRRHVGAQKRDVRRQVPLRAPPPGMTSMDLAQDLVGGLTTPSGAAMRDELRQAVGDALETLSPLDRDVLVLRHFEDLTNGEVAAELGIETSAASKRYLRALRRVGATLRAQGVEELGA